MVANDHEQRHALINFGLEPGEDLCRAFLLTPDFRGDLLRRLVHRSVDKVTLAGDAARRAIADAKFAATLVLEFCKQPRKWLAFQLTELTKPGQTGRSAVDLLTNFGPGGWYGPFVENDVHWWVYCHIASHHHVVGQEGTKTNSQTFPTRWHIVAKVTGDCVSIHWNNFNYNETSEDAVRDISRQFPYWRFAPGALRSIGERYGATVDEATDLHTFILHTLYDRYPQTEVAWQHLKVRALNQGVSVNASGREELAFSGVQKLTRSLARTALTELSQPLSEDNVRRLDQAMLRTVLQEWGLRSYNFSVMTPDGRSFRAHCYFGADDAVDGPDRFPHFQCQIDRGGSSDALQFLLSEMRDGGV